MPTGGFTSLLSPDACQTAIDSVAYESYGRGETPNYLMATNEMFFKQGTTDKIVYVWDEDSNVGAFESHTEQQEVNITNTIIGNQKTNRVTKYLKNIPISWEAFKTDQVGKREAIGRQIGDRAALTRDKFAILTTYADAFSGSFATTPDGTTLSSNSHTTLTGITVDNQETGVMTPDNAWTLYLSLANQKAQDGELGGHNLTGVLVPTILYKTAKEVLNSELIANSAENNLNIFETDFGDVAIKQSQFLGSTYNSNTSANTSYHFVSKDHMIMRKVLSELNMTMIEPQYSRTDSYEERARFAEQTFPESWTGYVASTGASAS